MKKSYLPPLSAALIEELDAQNPARCIKPGESVEDAHRYAGRRALIEELLARLQAAERDGLRDAMRNPS